MTSVGLIVCLIVTWALFRLLAGRVTLSTADFFRVFLLGGFASTIFAIVIERLFYFWLDLDFVTRAAAAPVDELAKALPVLVIVALLASRRTLTVSDYALTGLAGGLGYEFVNWSLAIVSDVEPHTWHRYLFGSLGLDALPAYFLGAITAAFVGLVAGVTQRLTRRRSIVIAFTLLAVLVAAFDNGMFRWQTGSLLSIFNVRNRAVSEAFADIHALLLNGRLELWLLVGGLLIANWLEGRWTRVTAPADQERYLLDEDASVAFVPVEWLVAARRWRSSWAAFLRVGEFFRDRRAYALISAEHRRSPSDMGLQSAAAALEQKLKFARVTLDEREGRVGRRDLKIDVRPLAQWLSTHPLEVVLGLMFVLCFMIPPNASPLLKAILFNDWLVLLALAGAAALLVLRRRKSEGAEPELGSSMFAGEFGAFIVRAALMTTLVALAAYFIPTETLIANYTVSRLYPLEPFELWSAGSIGYPLYGGNPHTFFAVAALILSRAASGWPSQARTVGEPQAASRSRPA